MLIPLPLDDEQRAFQDSVRALLEKTAPSTPEDMVTDGAYVPEVWQRLGSLGVTGLNIPESFGGSDAGETEMFIAFRESGRVLLASPLFATLALAGSVLMEAGSPDAQRELLPLIASGDITATVAVCEDSASWDPAAVTMTAAPGADGHVLTGTKRFVIDGGTANVILVLARSESGLGVFAVDSEAPGMTVAPLVTLDLTRPQVDLHFQATPARLVSTGDDAEPAVRRGLLCATRALVAEQVGGAEHVMQAALAYAKLREQFGRPIGSFQAIKHKLAEMAFDLERMNAAAWHAVQSAADGSVDEVRGTHLAKAFCSEAFFRLAAENIQIHGGIGVTWENSAHLYFRRAKSSEFVLGDPGRHAEDLLASLLGDLEELQGAR